MITERGEVKPCPCPGPLCGDMTYEEIYAKMVQVGVTHDQSPNDLLRIHRKWKRLGAEVRVA